MTEPEDLMARLRESIDLHKRPVTSSAQTPEPTDEQRAVAADVVRDITGETHLTVGEHGRSVDTIARALAAAVTAEREKYLRVADELEREARAGLGGEVDGLHRAAGRIREVSR